MDVVKDMVEGILKQEINLNKTKTSQRSRDRLHKIVVIDGQVNKKFNVVIVKSWVIIYLNGVSCSIEIKLMSQKVKHMILCFFHVKYLQIIDKYVWLQDSVCRNHMIGHNDLLSNLDTSLITTISLGDDHAIKTSRKGVVPVLTKQGEVKNIPHIYYVPNIKHNLLSVGKLMVHGYDVTFHNNTCTILNTTK
jgi:hypothetical protein